MANSVAADDSVIYEERGAVALVTLNRPQALNSFTRAMHAGLQAAMARASANPAVRAFVITGAGRGFCAGLDLKSLLDKDGRVHWTVQEAMELQRLFAGLMQRDVVQPAVVERADGAVDRLVEVDHVRGDARRDEDLPARAGDLDAVAPRPHRHDRDDTDRGERDVDARAQLAGRLGSDVAHDASDRKSVV